MSFDPGAIAAISEQAEEQNMSALQICQQLFRDYQFGLKLIQKNTGQGAFSRMVLPTPRKLLQIALGESC